MLIAPGFDSILLGFNIFENVIHRSPFDLIQKLYYDVSCNSNLWVVNSHINVSE